MLNHFQSVTQYLIRFYLIRNFNYFLTEWESQKFLSPTDGEPKKNFFFLRHQLFHFAVISQLHYRFNYLRIYSTTHIQSSCFMQRAVKFKVYIENRTSFSHNFLFFTKFFSEKNTNGLFINSLLRLNLTIYMKKS